MYDATNNNESNTDSDKQTEQYSATFTMDAATRSNTGAGVTPPPTSGSGVPSPK